MPTPATTPARLPMTPLRKTALIAGVFYLVTFIFSIPVKFWLWDDAVNNPDFVLGAGSSGGVLWGATFEIITALACVGTAVALYSVSRRSSERAALGFVTARVMEAAVIFVGVLSVLSLFTLREDVAGAAGADSASLLTTAHALAAIHDWTFLIGPGLFPVINALCLGTVMYRSRLVPRIIPTIGLIGAPLLLASGIATLFGVFDQVSAPSGLLALPIAAWELSVGVWMTFKGFKPSAGSDDRAASTAPVAYDHVAA